MVEEESKEENRTVEEDEKDGRKDVGSKGKEIMNKGEQDGENMDEMRGVKGENRGQIILGLRFSRDRLHFLFRGHRGVIEQWVFRGLRLADNRWHTVVLAISGHHVRLTVDCSSPLEM